MRFLGRSFHTCLFRLICLFVLTVLATALRAQVTKAHLASRELGWAVVDSHVFVTTNEGSTWSEVTPPHAATDALSDVTFVDRSTGFVSFAAVAPGSNADDPKHDLIVARTTDGGQTWQRTTIPYRLAPRSYPTGLDFINPLDGWLMARQQSSSNFDVGTLFATSDGGKTWRTLPDPPTGDAPYFVTKKLGWLAGGAGGRDFWRTDDGGSSWQAVTVPYVGQQCGAGCSPRYQVPLFTDPDHGWLTVRFSAGDDESVNSFSTKDGGKTWVLAQPTGEPENGYEFGETVETQNGPVRLRSTKEGLALKSQGVRQTPRSGPGAARPGTEADVSAAGLVNESEGWVIRSETVCPPHEGLSTFCPQASELLLTRDGGHSYETVTPVVPKAPHAQTIPSLDGISTAAAVGPVVPPFAEPAASIYASFWEQWI